MVVKVHLTQNDFVLDVVLPLVGEAQFFLALFECSLVELNIEAREEVLEDGSLDHAALQVVDLL